MEAFCGKWRMDREGCEGEREFYEADGSIPDPEMIDKILEADCIVSMAEMEDAGKFDYKIEFVGLFVLDEDFLLGEEKTITLPHTGEEVTSVVELGEDGSMVSTVKKSNGDTVVHVGTIAEDGALEVVNTLTKEDGTEVVSKNRHVKVEEE